jgi:hypothetical protein
VSSIGACLGISLIDRLPSGASDQVLSKATLRDLLQNEEEMNSWVRTISGASGLRLMQ